MGTRAPSSVSGVMTRSLCPYCLQRTRDSRDHVFPDFLGGRSKVGACRGCNSTFGSQFEAAVSSDLAPIAVVLAFSGYKHPRRVTYREAFFDEELGVNCDLDSEKQAYPSHPSFKEVDGKPRVVAANLRQAKSMLPALLERSGGKEPVLTSRTRQMRPALRNLRLSIGPEIRRLALKMCIGLSELRSLDAQVESKYRTELFSRNPADSSIRLTSEPYEALERLAPKMCHFIYLEGNPVEQRSYGVVGYFGACFTFYVPMCDGYRGAPFAHLATLNLATFKECFSDVQPLGLAEAPTRSSLDNLVQFHQDWGPRLNSKILSSFGKNSLLLNMADTQEISGVRHEIPIVWVEHDAVITIELALHPGIVHDQLVLEANPKEWIMSNDQGVTRLPLLEQFILDWNSGTLPRDYGREHVYHSPLISPNTRIQLVDGNWCPVGAAMVRFFVKPRAYKGTVEVEASEGRLNVEQGSVESRIQLDQSHLPKRRDPMWPEVNPEDYQEQGLWVKVEKWQINMDGIAF
jgi:hypothetical protein